MAGSMPSCRSSSLHQLIPCTITEAKLALIVGGSNCYSRSPTGGLLGVALFEYLDHRFRSPSSWTLPPEAKQKGINLNRILLLDLSPTRDRVSL